MTTTGQEYIQRRWIALILLCFAQFIVVLDASIVNVALPSIGEGLDFSQENLAWVVNAYVLTFGGFLLLGGRMADILGRRRVFISRLLPVALVVAALTPSVIAESRSESATRHFDTAGAVSVTAGLSLLVYAIVDATDAGWGSAQTLGLLALSAALIAAFVAIELRSDAPLVPFRIFRLRTLTGANVVGLLVGASLFSMFFFITFYMPQVLGYSPIKAGLSYLPLALMIIVASGIASQLVTRIGFKPVLTAGMAFIAVALVWFSQVSVGGGFVTDILGPSLLAATGLGFAFVTTTIAAVSGVRDQESGLASGLINTSQQIGGGLGVAVLATIANSRTDDLVASSGGDPSALANALNEGFQSAFLGGAGIAALGLVLTLVLIRGRDSRAHVELGAGGRERPAEA